jgi:putative amide transporter protein
LPPIVLGLGIERLTALTGWLTLILSFTTCTIPGYLLLLGEWGQVHTWLVLAVIAGTVAALLPVGARAVRPASEPVGRAEVRTPVSAS